MWREISYSSQSDGTVEILVTFRKILSTDFVLNLSPKQKQGILHDRIGWCSKWKQKFNSVYFNLR